MQRWMTVAQLAYFQKDLTPIIACSEFQCKNMSLNEILLLEVQNIRIFSELVLTKHSGRMTLT